MATGIAVDFTGVEAGPARLPEGDYLLKVKMVKAGASSKAKTPMVRVTYVIADGRKKGTEVVDDLYLTEKTLWRVRAWLEAMGETKLGGKFAIQPRKYIGKLVGATIADETQEGFATRSRINGYFDAENIEGDDADDDVEDEDYEGEEDKDDTDVEDEDEDAEDDEESEDEDDEEEDDDNLESLSNDELKARAKAAGVTPIPKRLSTKSKPALIAAIVAAESDEEEDEPEEDEDDLADLDRAELKAIIKEEELEVRVTKGMSDDDIREAITEARPEDEEEPDDEDEEEEEEEEEPAPPPKRKAKPKTSTSTAKTGKPKAKRAAYPSTDDDLDDLDLDDL